MLLLLSLEKVRHGLLANRLEIGIEVVDLVLEVLGMVLEL